MVIILIKQQQAVWQRNVENEMFDFIVKNQDEAVRPQKTRGRTCTVYMGEVSLPPLSLPLSLSLSLSPSLPLSPFLHGCAIVVCMRDECLLHSLIHLLAAIGH